MSVLKSLFSKEQQRKLEDGLASTRKSFLSKLGTALVGRSKIDDDLLDELEAALIQSDVGVATTVKIIEALETRTAKDKYMGTDALSQIMREEILGVLSQKQDTFTPDFESPFPSTPHIIMVVGVNGVGKTTTIGKLAHHYHKAGKQVLLGAADTFRAGAIDQLQVWADRVGVPIVRQQMGSDPAAVAFDTLQSAISKKSDLAIIDTAGRLHNKVNLMNELTKVKRVMDKVVPGAPHEVLLVLDGSTGQNAFEQAKQFTAATEVTALAVTKLDGTAKGGVVLGISDQFNIPVKFIGVGEGIDDLQWFDKNRYINTLFE